MPLLRLMGGIFAGSLPIETTVPPAGLMTASASGVIVTLLKPALDVTRITPMQALRVRADAERQAGFLMRHSWKIGLGLMAIAVADQAVSVVFHTLSMLPVELFLVIAFMGVTLLVPAAVGVIERVIRRAMFAVYGMPGRLGSLNIQRNRGRAALTASVMTIGAAMTIAMGGVEISFKRELLRWVNETLTNDSVIGSSFTYLSTSYGVLPSDVGPMIAATDGVSGVTGERLMYVIATGATTPNGFAARREGLLLRVIDPATYRNVASLRFAEDNDRAAELWDDFAQGDALFVSGLVQQIFRNTAKVTRPSACHSERSEESPSRGRDSSPQRARLGMTKSMP